MYHRRSGKLALQASASILILMSSQFAASAQEAPTEDNSEFLGTLQLGQSKREVQTDTATPETKVDQEEIDDRQASTIAELVDSVPGVTLINGSTPTGSGINIRGFGANGTYGTDQKVAIMVDNASVGSEELYRIGTQLYTDPSLYKSVDVIRGTVGSFEYGSGIIGGVIRLETKDASDFTGGEPGLRLRQTLGGHTNEKGFLSSTTLAWQPDENLEFLANYTWRTQDDQNDGDGNEISNSAFQLPSLLVKGRYTFGQDGAHSVTASYTQSETSDRDVPYDSFGTSSGIFGNVDRDTKSQTATLGYNFNPVGSDLIDTDIILSYANQEIEQEAVGGGGFAVINADHKYETTKLTAKNSAFLVTGPLSHELRTGVEFIRKERMDANSAPGGTDERQALFVVDQISFGEGWTFSPALRYEASDIDGILDSGGSAQYDNEALMGGASLRYQFANGFALFGSYAYTESLPIIDDLENATYMEQAEIANTYELGASYDRIGVFGQDDSLSLKANYYSTLLGDVTSYSGVSDVDLEGLEIEGSYALKSGIYADLNVNITDAEQTNTAGVVSDWANSPADSLQLALGKHFGRIADLSWELVAVDDADRNGTTTDGYVIHNLRATFTPQSGLLKETAIRISLENAADESYTPLLSTRPAPGRNLKVSIARTF